VAGTVTLSPNSRIVFEPGDESVAVYYILELVNAGGSPVDPNPPFKFDMPKGAQSTTLLDGTSPIVRSSGAHVSLAGPVPPGNTLIQVVAELPTDTGAIDVTQAFPADMSQLAVLVRKVGNTKLASPDLTRQQEFPDQGQTVIGAVGGAVPAGKSIELHLTDLPHHSTAPRYTALTLAGAVILAGAWFATRRQDSTAREGERKRLVARREKLFGELVKIERERRSGRADQKSAARRDELIGQLEHVYGALDDADHAGATA
jgi:hypothetical protein